MEESNVEGLDDISLNSDGCNMLASEASGTCHLGEYPFGIIESDVDIGEGIAIEGVVDFANVDWEKLYSNHIFKYNFPNREVAFKFYNCYGKMNGFSGRRSRVFRNKERHVIHQTFVCHKHGFRDGKYVHRRKRSREPKGETRCGCQARMKVGLNSLTNRWEVLYFFDEHNHDLYEDMFKGMLPAHREMHNDDIFQMNSMRDVGIRTPSIFSSFASQLGGHRNLDFILRDMYNQIERQRREVSNDATAALDFISDMAKNDVELFCSHTTDDEGRLQHLFWCDGICRADYQIFGDVLAFDATYGKNKYYLPVVVFSGVNHHNKTTVFGFGVIADETEDTYVWLLDQFLKAMNGKSPVSVITDGDKAMKNAISTVFSNSNHRLCAWHLLKNATSNVKKPKFTKEFKKCMMGDFDIGEFKRLWEEMVKKFGLENNKWVLEMYEKRHMWCSAYLRGKFFAGYRTTSRCEGFHSLMKKYVNSKFSLHDFVLHLVRCLNEMRFRELEDDFASAHGFPILQTNYPILEKFGATVFTRAIFKKFRNMIVRGCNMEVVGLRKSVGLSIYIISKHSNGNKRWHVSYDKSDGHITCSCALMETFGMPCEHIIRVLVELKVDELPPSMVLNRWTKRARALVHAQLGNGFKEVDSSVMVRKVALLDFCRKMCDLASQKPSQFMETRLLIRNHIDYLMTDVANDSKKDGSENVTVQVKNPVRVRTKGSAQQVPTMNGRFKRVSRCGLCKGTGHNRKTCHMNDVDEVGCSSTIVAEEEEYSNNLSLSDVPEGFE